MSEDSEVGSPPTTPTEAMDSQTSSENVVKHIALSTIRGLIQEVSEKKAVSETCDQYWKIAQKAVREETPFGEKIQWAFKFRRSGWGPKELEYIAKVQRGLRKVELGYVSTSEQSEDSESCKRKATDSEEEAEWKQLQEAKRLRATFLS